MGGAMNFSGGRRGMMLKTTRSKAATIRQHRPIQIAAAVGVASGAFAFLNGCGALEMSAAAISGGIGQWSRSWLSRRKLNQYGVAAVCAVIVGGRHTGSKRAVDRERPG